MFNFRTYFLSVLVIGYFGGAFGGEFKVNQVRFDTCKKQFTILNENNICFQAKKNAANDLLLNMGFSENSKVSQNELNDALKKNEELSGKFTNSSEAIARDCSDMHTQCVNDCAEVLTFLEDATYTQMKVDNNRFEKPKIQPFADKCESYAKDASNAALDYIVGKDSYFKTLIAEAGLIDSGGKSNGKNEKWSTGKKIGAFAIGAMAIKALHDYRKKNDTDKAASTCDKDRNLESTVTKPGCTDMYIDTCNIDPSLGGCASFATSYCGFNTTVATVGSGSSFCELMESHKYCSQPGTAKSPSCADNSYAGTSGSGVYSGACALAESESCLALQASCVQFPTDPKCKELEKLDVVSGTFDIAATEVQNTTINTGGIPPITTSSATVNRAVTSSGIAPDGGIACALCTSNFSNGSSTYSALCAAGRMSGCVGE